MAKKKTKGRTSKRQKSEKTLLKLLGIALLAITMIFAILFATRQVTSESIADIFRTATVPQSITNDSESLLSVVIPDEKESILVNYTGYTVSFNPALHIPNYVVYELTAQETEGKEKRSDSFRRDNNIEGCPEPSDYTRSGFDRGHMAPAADMKWSESAMRESFFMTNICPQRHALNGGGWKRLEEKVRDWAVRDRQLIIVSGPIISDNPQRLSSDVAIPEQFFKVILAPKANRAIGFIYKNEGGQKKIERQAVSVDSVENATGYDFFHNLPDEIETSIEKSCNYIEWNN